MARLPPKPHPVARAHSYPAVPSLAHLAYDPFQTAPPSTTTTTTTLPLYELASYPPLPVLQPYSLTYPTFNPPALLSSLPAPIPMPTPVPRRRKAAQPPTSSLPSSLPPASSSLPRSGGGGGLLAPDYPINPAGPASSASTVFKCPKCDKVYKGKHARSIWRRHLQDKHGIPLASQPRRTRWDNDANRPKSEEERRARTLDSKRRWARKHRAERTRRSRAARGEGDLSSDGEGDEDDGSIDERDLEGWQEEDEDGEEGDWETYATSGGAGGRTPVPAPSSRLVYPKLDAKEGRRSSTPRERERPAPVAQPAVDERWPLHHRDPNSYNAADAFSTHPSFYSPFIPVLPGATSTAQSYLPGHPLHSNSMASTSTSDYYATNPPVSTASSRATLARVQTWEQPHYGHGHGNSNDNGVLVRETFGGGLHSPVRLLVGGGGRARLDTGVAVGEVAGGGEDAACVLLALKASGSSPSSPAPQAPRPPPFSTAHRLQMPASPLPFPSQRRSLSPPSVTRSTDPSSHSLKRSLSESPPSQGNSPQRHQIPSSAAGLSAHKRSRSSALRTTNNYNVYTSLVATPTPAMRRAMESSPVALDHEREVSQDTRRVVREESPSAGGIGAGGRRRLGRRERDSSGELGFGSGSGLSEDGEDVKPVSTLIAKSSQQKVAALAVSSHPQSESDDNTLPAAHPGSSSSAASYNLTTPHGPSYTQSTHADPFSSAPQAQQAHFYPYLLHHPHNRAYPHSTLRSSPPSGSGGGGYSFSSPAHPGVSKQLGLFTLAGPGVLSGIGEGEGGGVEGEGELLMMGLGAKGKGRRSH